MHLDPSQNGSQYLVSNGRRDAWVVRLAVFMLGMTALLTGAGITLLALYHVEIPPALGAIGGTALGALAGLISGPLR